MLANAIGNTIGRRRAGVSEILIPASLSDKFLFLGQYSKITGGQMPNLVGDDYLTVTGDAGSEVYKCPNTAAYIAADTDYIWFGVSGTQRNTSTAELTGYDLQRTPVKYADETPYVIDLIGILKAGEVLSEGELNDLHTFMSLPLYWIGTINDFGVLKGNRGVGQNLYVTPPESASISQIGEGTGLQITWDDVCLNADSFKIWRSDDNVTYDILDTVLPGIGTYVDEKTLANKVYYYKITAYKNDSNSIFSNTVNETTALVYDLATTALITRMTGVSETPNDARKLVIDNNIRASKQLTVPLFDTKFDALWLLSSHGSNSALFNIIKDAHNITLVNSPAFIVDRGFTGSTNNALNANYNPSTDAILFTRNASSFGVYVRTDVNILGAVISAESTSFNGISLVPKTGGDAVYACNNGSFLSGGVMGRADGMWIITRRDANNFDIYRNGVLHYPVGVRASQALVNVVLHLLCRNIAGTLSNYATQEISLAFIGGAMTEVDVLNFQKIWVDGYLNSIGAKV